MTQNTPETESPATSTTDAAPEEKAVGGFTFSAAKLAELAKQKKTQPWYQKGNNCNHDQRPGPAPRGTRRAMGKR